MKKVFLYAIASLFYSINSIAVAGITFHEKTHQSFTDSSNVETKKALKKMQVSMTGKTENGNAYELYAIKAKKDWVFLIADSVEIYSIKYDKDQGELIEDSQSSTDILCLSARTESLKKKAKSMNLAGMDIDCYYKLKGKAAKMYKSMKKMNDDAKKAGKVIKDGFKAIKKGKSGIKKTKSDIKQLPKF